MAFSSIQLAQSAPSLLPEKNDATQQQNILIDKPAVEVAFRGLTSGSIDVKITTDEGKVYYFYGQSSDQAIKLGEFQNPGDYFDVEVTLHSTSPNFWRITASANLTVESPETFTSRVRWYDDASRFASITIVFD